MRGEDEADVPRLSSVEYSEKGRGEPEHEEMPEHVVQLSGGGYACMHCGGSVEAHGGSVTPADSDVDDEGGGDEPVPGQHLGSHQRESAFAEAVSYARHRRG